MPEPKIEDLISKADSKFALVMGAARRTRQITDFLNALGRGELIEEGMPSPSMTEAVTRRPFLIALKEIAEGKVKIEYLTEEKKRALEEARLAAKLEAKVEVKEEKRKEEAEEEEKKKKVEAKEKKPKKKPAKKVEKKPAKKPEKKVTKKKEAKKK